MLLLSEILQNAQIDMEYEIISEKSFDTLGLVNYSHPGKSQCTFIDDIRFLTEVKDNTKLIITTSEIAKSIDRVGLCITEKPRVLFFCAHNALKDNLQYKRSSIKTKMGSGCKVSKLAYIADENIQIGNDVTIEEFASIKENTVIGDHSIIRAGAVIGGEGFEFKKNNDHIISVVHLGGVVIGEHVEVQCNTCIDKAVYPWDNTVIGNHSKIDKLVYVAHGVKIGSNVLIVGQSGTLGRSVIGDNVKIGLGAGLRNAINIGANADISIGAVVTHDVMEGSKVSGNFAIDHKKYLKFIKSIK